MEDLITPRMSEERMIIGCGVVKVIRPQTELERVVFQRLWHVVETAEQLSVDASGRIPHVESVKVDSLEPIRIELVEESRTIANAVG